MTSVSVIIPYYQKKPGILRRALESVLMQKLPADTRVRTIVVDDGAPAPARDEIADLDFAPPFSLEMIGQPNAGVVAARNAGLDRAGKDADFIAFLDSDDWWEPQHLARGIEALQGCGGDFYFCDWSPPHVPGSYFRQIGLDERKGAPVPMPGVFAYKGDFPLEILSRWSVGTSTVMIRREALGDIRFDARLNPFLSSEDQMYFLECARHAGKILFDREIGATKGGGVSISRTKRGEAGYTNAKIGNFIFHRLVAKEMDFLSKEARRCNRRHMIPNIVEIVRSELSSLLRTGRVHGKEMSDALKSYREQRRKPALPPVKDPLRLSVIVCTHNRAHQIIPCLDSIAASLAHAAPVDAEIVVVDNNSTDDTSPRVREWAKNCAFPVNLQFEPRKGLSTAQNTGIRASKGELLAFTDDDCQMSKEYISDLLRHDALDTEPVLRGGRIELGDPTDYPLTIITSKTLMRWNKQKRSARDFDLVNCIYGCNMTMRRTLIEKLGFFDERFGSGAALLSCSDCDYTYRTYLAGMSIEYVPDMVVFHYHGRKMKSDAQKLFRKYMTGRGALYAKHILNDPYLCRQLFRDGMSALKGVISGKNNFIPGIGVSYRRTVACNVLGVAKYVVISIRGAK